MLLRVCKAAQIAVRNLSLVTAKLAKLGLTVNDLAVENNYYIQTTEALDRRELQIIRWIVRFDEQTWFYDYPTWLEVGPRLNFETSHSSTAIDIFRKCGVNKVIRIERSTSYGFPIPLSEEQGNEFLESLYDRMTEMPYSRDLTSFASDVKPQSVTIIPLLEKGREALETFNIERKLGMDTQDLDFYCELFFGLGRKPTSVEIVGLTTCNSDHSRHRQFGGIYIRDGIRLPYSCMELVKETWKRNPGNSVVAFSDNASAIRGGQVSVLQPEHPGQPSRYVVKIRIIHNSIKVETHNHPTFIEPFQGASTGVGGILRDLFTIGRGGLMGVLGAMYSVGNLNIPGYVLPWEDDGWKHSGHGESPLNILIQASDGGSFYGNCVGSPVVFGSARTFGMSLPEGYRSYLKPIMLAAAAGFVDDNHLKKNSPAAGMLVVQIGTPAHRIGVGGASGSSFDAGQRSADLDWNSVQRGDPEMGQRGCRVVRACVELGDENPIENCNDLGGGGEDVSLTELCSPAGARLRLRSIPVADPTLSTEEIWVNEDQERDAFLIRPENFERFAKICDRENCPYAIVGEITGDGWLVLHDAVDNTEPINLPLEKILGNLPRKVFEWNTESLQRTPLELPADLTLMQALDRVLRLVSVGSKKFLTNKVDRSVTGLVAQQQCVGPNHLPLSDYAVMANSYFDLTGVALSMAEQPVKGLVDHKAMARLTVAEALLNMGGALITDASDIKLSANWMWAPRHPGEGARLYETALALRDFVIEVESAIHGGKDSLSMAGSAIAPNGAVSTSKAPGTLVITASAPMKDITRKVTCDLKQTGNFLVYVDLSDGQARLGGSALAQVYKQVGNDCPDIEAKALVKGMRVEIELLAHKLITACHDVSDGGLVTTLLEMAFGGNVGINVDFSGRHSAIRRLFSESPGYVFETPDAAAVISVLEKFGLTGVLLGKVSENDGDIVIRYNGDIVLSEAMIKLRHIWNSTSTESEKLQADPRLVRQEEVVDFVTRAPPYQLSFKPSLTAPAILGSSVKPRVAILREEGNNSDREMAAVTKMAGFDSWDVNMDDLAKGFSLKDFQMVIAVGGFSFRDEFGAGRGQAAVIRFNPRIMDEFSEFMARKGTASLGVCNGCQASAIMGWPTTGYEYPDGDEPIAFGENLSGRFESRFSTVRVFPSPASEVYFHGMERSALGIWVAHGEGRPVVSREMLQWIENNNLAPLRYVDCNGEVTEYYPYNPATSPRGIAAICSLDGRHLAMMPHPERTFLKWQWPWMPKEWNELVASPWLRMFQNARNWCDEA